MTASQPRATISSTAHLPGYHPSPGAGEPSRRARVSRHPGPGQYTTCPAAVANHHRPSRLRCPRNHANQATRSKAKFQQPPSGSRRITPSPPTNSASTPPAAPASCHSAEPAPATKHPTIEIDHKVTQPSGRTRWMPQARWQCLNFPGIGHPTLACQQMILQPARFCCFCHHRPRQVFDYTHLGIKMIKAHSAQIKIAPAVRAVPRPRDHPAGPTFGGRGAPVRRQRYSRGIRAPSVAITWGNCLQVGEVLFPELGDAARPRGGPGGVAGSAVPDGLLVS